MALDSITPGQTITVKVTKPVTSDAASKTIKRLFAKDESVKAELDRRAKVRRKGFAPTRRGGRFYGGHVRIGHEPVKGQQGEAGTIRATVDVIRDLRSIERFVEVDAG
ncbi:MAG: hypothetical protein AAGB29_07010 [Planctomycetota bacterium]